MCYFLEYDFFIHKLRMRRHMNMDTIHTKNLILERMTRGLKWVKWRLKLRTLIVTFSYFLAQEEGNTSSRIIIDKDKFAVLCNDARWCSRILVLARGIVSYCSVISSLPRQCVLTADEVRCLCKFLFLPLAVGLDEDNAIISHSKIQFRNHKMWRYNIYPIECVFAKSVTKFDLKTSHLRTPSRNMRRTAAHK